MSANRIGILKGGGINPLGNTIETNANENYLNGRHFLKQNHSGNWISILPDSLVSEIDEFIFSNNLSLEKFSREAKMISFVLHRLLNQFPKMPNSILNVATSRGSVDFLAQQIQEKKNLPVYSSPHSTLGFLSSWPDQIGRDMPVFQNSSTCSSFGMSLLNAKAWLKSGMADCYVAASVESPTQDITVDQLKALRIYSNVSAETDYPCRAFDFTKKSNSLVLGEASYAFILKNNILDCLYSIDGLGVGVEKATTSTSLTEGGEALKISILNALKDADFPKIDLIIGHFPGTVKGDLAEFAAYKSIFGEEIPPIFGNKWKIGHSLGSSLASNLDLALFMLEKQKFASMPAYHFLKSTNNYPIKNILINSLGFGGQAVSAIVAKV